MISQLITSFISTSAFGIIFNIPKQTLLKCGFVGALGWMIYVILIHYGVNVIVATLIASFSIAVTGQSFARIYKAPMTLFSVSGIIPLVPGGIAYDAMRNFVENDYNEAIQLAAKAFMLSGSITIGLVISEVIDQLIRRFLRKRRDREV